MFKCKSYTDFLSKYHSKMWIFFELLWIDIFHFYFHPNLNYNSAFCLQPKFKLSSNAKPWEWRTILFCIYPYCQLPEIKCMMCMHPVPVTGSGCNLWEDSTREDFVRNDCHFHLIWLCLFSWKTLVCLILTVLGSDQVLCDLEILHCV